MAEKIRIAVLVSGGGTNLQALLDAQAQQKLTAGEIVLVVSNRKNAYALQRAEMSGVESVTLTRKQCASQQQFECRLQQILHAHRIEMIVLAGFLSILSAEFTACWEKRILNVHPSLIPAFCGEGYYGLKVHEAVLARGVKVTGATVHYVNEIPDGGEIVLQKAVPVYKHDTAERLQQRVMRQAEWILLPRATQMVCQKLQQQKGEV